MTNREKYKEKRDAYDMMMTIWETGVCPIRVIGGESCLPRYLVCKAFDEDCPACIQNGSTRRQNHEHRQRIQQRV